MSYSIMNRTVYGTDEEKEEFIKKYPLVASETYKKDCISTCATCIHGVHVKMTNKKYSAIHCRYHEYYDEKRG